VSKFFYPLFELLTILTTQIEDTVRSSELKVYLQLEILENWLHPDLLEVDNSFWLFLQVPVLVSFEILKNLLIKYKVSLLPPFEHTWTLFFHPAGEVVIFC
jgi:hypothetical protein